MILNIGDSKNHPQHEILQKHITRAVYDLFLISIRNKSKSLLRFFNSEDQIESFFAKIISYWESLEKYEICEEILSASKKIKRDWKKIKPGVTPENEDSSFIMLRDLFDPEDKK
jgi:hypothetical protein